MSVTACQGLGFVVSLLGIAGVIATTCMDQWSTQDLYNNPVTAVFNYQGLWRSCVRESSGFTECRGYFTLLGLPDENTMTHISGAICPNHPARSMLGTGSGADARPLSNQIQFLQTQSIAVGSGHLFSRVGTTLPAPVTPYGNRERVPD
ncbi:hypothetical protein G4228_012651 [Cervus hanglu yarkandensis]|nr:hypothetical protein G4228_012651 [Cervus hanglu yarkandensis]